MLTPQKFFTDTDSESDLEHWLQFVHQEEKTEQTQLFPSEDTGWKFESNSWGNTTIDVHQ